MIIAEQKKKENIAEYLLYMYQVEDLIRANGFDPVKIEQNIIGSFDTGYDVKREMLEWYKGLIHRMASEGVEKRGHMKMLQDIANELDQLNLKLLHSPYHDDFKEAFDKAKPNLEALRMKAGHNNDHDVQLALDGLYGLLILKLQKKEISRETLDAFKTISEWIALLASEYMQQT
ncbi:MAG: DUF4924 family protein [Bacteroidales bacterium]|nr:DUF4924 family protein [Bacteroidales bacterium]